MSHPYPKPVLPKWPATPLLPAPTSHAGYFTTAFDADGRSGLWGCDEFFVESNDYINSQVPGTHEARSAKYFLDQITATTGQKWQVQDAPGLNAQQAASVNAGCTSARMWGMGTTGWVTALHDPMDGSPWTPIVGGAFSNDNYKNGVVSFNGITSDEVLTLLRNSLTSYIRAGGISE